MTHPIPWRCPHCPDPISESEVRDGDGVIVHDHVREHVACHERMCPQSPVAAPPDDAPDPAEDVALLRRVEGLGGPCWALTNSLARHAHGARVAVLALEAVLEDMGVDEDEVAEVLSAVLRAVGMPR